MKKKGYEQVFESEWHKLGVEGWQMACCDCGLVHNVTPSRSVRLKVERDNRATAALRKKHGIKVTVKNKKEW